MHLSNIGLNHVIVKYLAISELVHVANESGSKNETSSKLQNNVHYRNTKIKCAAIVFSIRKSTHIETSDTFKTTVTLLRQQPFLL